MAASEILHKIGAIQKPTITLASLGAGAGRSCAVIDNTTIRAEMWYVWLRWKTNTAPTALSPIKVYAAHHSNDGTTPLVPDGITTADAAVTTEPVHCDQIGEITLTNSATTSFPGPRMIVRNCGPKFSLVVWNGSNQSGSATGSDYELQVAPVTFEGQ